LKKYILTKTAQALVVMLLITLFSFALIHIMPGDAAVIYLGTEATNEELLAATRAEMNLDKPIVVQWILWIKDALHGDFGNSFTYHRSVSSMVGDRIGITFTLGFVSLCISVILSLILGTLAATHRDGFLDNVINVLANIGISAPSFWISILLIYILALGLGWLPVQGYVPPSENFVLSMKHMVMPCFVMAMPSLATLTRQTRASVLDVLNEDYVRTARSKGLKERIILIKHVLKNALIPILTVLGMSIGQLFGGSVMVEQMFNIPGMGQLVNNAVINRDLPIIQAYIVIISFVVIFSALLVDIAYGLVDPRVRVAKGGD